MPPAAQEALAADIVAVSLAHSVLSRFTAFVAVDPAKPAEPTGPPHRIVQPVEMPSGWATPMAAMPMAAGRALPMVAPGAAGPVAAPPKAPVDWREIWARVEEILGRLEEGAHVDADEVDRLADALRLAGAPGKITAAVEALAAGVRGPVAAETLAELVGAVRDVVPRRRRFWR